MYRLNEQKQLLLNQVRNNEPNNTVEKLRAIVDHYEDLSVSDFKGVISKSLYEELSSDPREVKLWNEIQSSSISAMTMSEIQDVQGLISTYLMNFPDGKHIVEVNKIAVDLQNRLGGIREASEWNILDKSNYNKLLAYRAKYPNSVHLSEIDDLMWSLMTASISESGLRRYLCDWPSGAHSKEANDMLKAITDWNDIKREHNIFKIKNFLDGLLDSPLKNEVTSVYYTIRDEHLQKMKENPSDFTYDAVSKYIGLGIFTEWELIDEKLMTEESYKRMSEDRSSYPDIQQFQQEDPNVEAVEGSTDIYLFGIPGTGKTCLLMGLAGADGNGYALNTKIKGGPYASALQEYVTAGITPGRTFGTFVTTISGSIQETKRNTIIDHNINLVEMSGEEFAIRIADGKEATLAEMGTGATNLLRNDNRKVFFIIVDSTKDEVKVEYLENVKDHEGNIIGQDIRKKKVNQLAILNKFASLFELPENQDIMSKVDAIHFVVTKADMLGDVNDRLNNARNLLLSKYQAPITKLKNYCRKTKSINYSTNYNPQVFTFSLGHFYLGDVFDFDDTETLKIVDAIRAVTFATKSKSWLNRFEEFFN